MYVLTSKRLPVDAHLLPRSYDLRQTPGCAHADAIWRETVTRDTWKPGSGGPMLVFVVNANGDAVRHTEIDAAARSISKIASVADTARILHDARTSQKLGVREKPVVFEREPVAAAAEVVRGGLPTLASETKPPGLRLGAPMRSSVDIRVNTQPSYPVSLKICLKVGIFAAHPDHKSVRGRRRCHLCGEPWAKCDERSKD